MASNEFYDFFFVRSLVHLLSFCIWMYVFEWFNEFPLKLWPLRRFFFVYVCVSLTVYGLTLVTYIFVGIIAQTIVYTCT